MEVYLSVIKWGFHRFLNLFEGCIWKSHLVTCGRSCDPLGWISTWSQFHLIPFLNRDRMRPWSSSEKAPGCPLWATGCRTRAPAFVTNEPLREAEAQPRICPDFTVLQRSPILHSGPRRGRIPCHGPPDLSRWSLWWVLPPRLGAVPAPSFILSLCISFLMTSRTTSGSPGPMVFFGGIQGVPFNAWGIHKWQLLLLVFLQHIRFSGWVSASLLESSAYLTVNGHAGWEPSFVVGEISVQILPLPVLSEQPLARYLTSLSLSFLIYKMGEMIVLNTWLLWGLLS